MTDVLTADAAAVDLGLLVLRVLVGTTFALHGTQKLFGWFGGGGPAGTAAWFASLGFGDGRAAVLLAATGELAGGLGLATGTLTPLAATAMVGTMTTAAFVNNAAKGFWSSGNGWELNGYLIVVAVAVSITGPGRWSVDAVLGLDEYRGPVVGVLVALVGITLGWLRWATRRRDRATPS